MRIGGGRSSHFCLMEAMPLFATATGVVLGDDAEGGGAEALVDSSTFARRTSSVLRSARLAALALRFALFLPFFFPDQLAMAST